MPAGHTVTRCICPPRPTQILTGDNVVESHGIFDNVKIKREDGLATEYELSRTYCNDGRRLKDCWVLAPIYDPEDPTKIVAINGYGKFGGSCPKDLSDAKLEAHFELSDL